MALAAGIALRELRPADGAGLEEMFLALTADTQRDDTPKEQQHEHRPRSPPPPPSVAAERPRRAADVRADPDAHDHGRRAAQDVQHPVRASG